MGATTCSETGREHTPVSTISENSTEHPPQVRLSANELTLHLIASGLTVLVQNVTDGYPVSIPYPPALQRGLDRIVVACLRQAQAPPRSIVELIDWCRKPLSSWPLALPEDAIGTTDTLLIGDFPTRICDGWACAKPDVEAEIGEQHLIRSVFQTCMEANNTTAYTAFRSLLIQHPVLTAFEFQQQMMRPELDILREHVRAAYTPAPVTLTKSWPFWPTDAFNPIRFASHPLPCDFKQIWPLWPTNAFNPIRP